MGDKQHTQVKTQTRSCVWDHLFFFSLHDVDRERLEAGLVKISVFDADKMSRDDLIGTCEFDCLDVYQQVRLQSLDIFSADATHMYTEK